MAPEISSGEISTPPPRLYCIQDRSKVKTRSGGVFILVRNSLICTEQAKFRTNCEMVWVKLEVAGVHPLYICAYCKPKEDDQESLLELRKSIEMVKRQTSETKGNIWVLGDFDLPKLNWTDSTPTVKPDCSCTPTYDKFLDILNDFGFTQMVINFFCAVGALCMFSSWPTGVQLVFFFCSGVSRLFGAQGSPSSGSLLNL